MFTDAMRQGSAAVIRTAQKSPMELLVTIIEGDPTADAERLFRKWLDVVREDEDYLVPALRHTFTNMLSCLDRDRRNPRTKGSAVAQSVSQARVNKVKERVVSVILLNLTLPSGKLLRDATFKECAKAGGWFLLVAKKGKPNQIVGKTMTEEQLRAL